MSNLLFIDENGVRTKFDIQPVMPDMEFWKTECDILYFGEISAHVVTGFETDGASIPVALRPLVGGPWGKHGPAAVVHDKLYKHNGCTRKQADDAMLDIMEILGVGWIRRQAIHKGLRIGGWVAWGEYRREPVKDVA